MSGWGGKREGAGRKPQNGEPKKLRSLRATEDEWLLIRRFAKIVKYGDKVAAQKFLDEHTVQFAG